MPVSRHPPRRSRRAALPHWAPASSVRRKEINGLSIPVEGTLALDPFSGHLFFFCNRKRSTLKILFWDRTRFCLWQKRMERDRFPWPERKEDVLEIDPRDLPFLLEGLDPASVRSHGKLHYETILWNGFNDGGGDGYAHEIMRLSALQAPI
ncbi:MAG: IS66 family insertion sequence element accessory protein TnpB [Syntrophobacter sp.]